MQPAKGQRKRIACAVVLVFMATVAASSAIGRTRSTVARPSTATQLPCTAGRCTLSAASRGSSITVVPSQVPAGKNPSFTAPTSNPAQGMLHGQRLTGVLDCSGYKPTDDTAYQFYLGGTFRGNVVYKVTYTVDTKRSSNELQFCLGATYRFRTLSNKQAKSVTLPNGLPGFAGLVPSCKNVPKGPCLVSKSATPNGRGWVLKLLIRAVEGGDPWGRS